MGEKKVTNVLLDRIKYFINAIENGEYEPLGYEFTIKFDLGNKNIVISDNHNNLNS